MQTHYEAINDDAPANEAFEVMNGLQVSRMVVVDHEKRIVGMLTEYDLVRAADEAEPTS